MLCSSKLESTGTKDDTVALTVHIQYGKWTCISNLLSFMLKIFLFCSVSLFSFISGGGKQ